MAEEIKQLQALLHELDSGDEEAQAGHEISSQNNNKDKIRIQKSISPDQDQNQSQSQTVKLKYGSLIKTIEASSRASSNSRGKISTGNTTTHNIHDVTTSTNTSCCKNCLRLMFTVFYLIYSKAWVIINFVFIFIVIFICYSIK